jgi:hypothetical protein
MKTAAIIALLLTASLCHAAEPRVALALLAYQPATSTLLPTAGTPPMPVIKAGQEFDLALVAQDLRPEGTQISKVPGPTYGKEVPLLRGVYAAYATVRFQKALSAMTASPPVYGPFHQSTHPLFPSCVGEESRINAMGSFFGTKIPPDESSIGINPQSNSEPVEIVRVRMLAKFPPNWIISQTTQVFSLDFASLSYPAHSTLLFGNVADIPPDQGTAFGAEIQATGVSVRILK